MENECDVRRLCRVTKDFIVHSDGSVAVVGTKEKTAVCDDVTDFLPHTVIQ